MTSLCNLPAELIGQIADGLCVNHAQHGSFRDRDYFDHHSRPDQLGDQVAGLAALANLCRTSKQFQDVATWRLYHTLAPGSRAMPNWWRLARTLITQPRLAAFVRHLLVPMAGPSELPPAETVPSEVTAHFAQRAALVFPDAIELADSLADPSSGLHDSALQSLFTILCPEVETLRCVADSTDFNFTLCTPGSLPALRSLEVAHWDRAKNGFDAEAVLLLLDAAPGLVHLRLVQPSGLLPAPDQDCAMLRRVEELELVRAALEAPELASWVRACPALEKLRYECGGERFGDGQFRPGEAVEAVARHAPRLTEFVLDLAEWEDAGELADDELTEAKEALEARGVVCRFSIGRGS
ncbi:hypothetical protein OQA88_5468 [Cercophora sp. LCS_1]